MVCTIKQIYLCLIIFVVVSATYHNISCYQCIRNIDEECHKEDLKPCPSSSDRCVTHISKAAEKGFTIKRECGLGPCDFRDLMINKGLGMDVCDRSNDEYFCLFCCQTNGCNHNGAVLHKPFKFIILVSILILYIFNHFQPPYVLNNEAHKF